MSKPTARCSFCGKPQDDVKKLIAAPGVFICDECVSLCNEILTEEMDETWTWASTAKPPEPLPWPYRTRSITWTPD